VVSWSPLIGASWSPLLFTSLAAQTAPALSKGDRSIVVTMLHQIEEDVEKHYYDPSFHGVDLKSQFRLAGQRLETARALTDAIATLSEILVQLDDSHTTLVPPNRRFRVDYGWQMAMVGDVPLVTAVDPQSDAAAKGVAPGDRVLLLNAFQPSRANLGRLTYFYRFIAPQTRQRVAVLKPDGNARTLDVVSRVQNKPITDLADLIADIEDVLDRARDRSAPVGADHDILVWKMVVFGNPASVEEMVRKAGGYRSLVLDLRANGGGSVEALRELVSRCFDREILLAHEKRRDKDTREVAKPAKSGFTGRLVVLVDSQSASAAEMFARIVQIEKRGTVLGDRTAGAVMTSRMFPHKIAGVGVYATSVTIGDVRMSDGASLEKVGVEPDEIVLPTPADLASQRDPTLARAIEIAGGSLTPEQAGRLFK
jgi:C-terminal processing protease CtpA/Prc